MARIYVASSWRNTQQPAVVRALRQFGHHVYDFRNPKPGDFGFAWGQVWPENEPKGSATVAGYKQALAHPRAAEGFLQDYRAMEHCDICALVLPSGRSAHLELGWCAGRGKRTVILTQDGEEPELMALLATTIVGSIEELCFFCQHGDIL